MRKILRVRIRLIVSVIAAGAAIGWAAWPVGQLHSVESTQRVVTKSLTTGRETTVVNKGWSEVKQILSARCISCHRNGTDQPDLTSYHAIIAAKTEDGEPLIVAGSPEKSWLWEMVNWNHSSKHGSSDVDTPLMPPQEKSKWLSGMQLQSIERWIRNGARETVDSQEREPLMLTACRTTE